MARFKEAPFGFVCPYSDRCPDLEGLSTTWVFAEYQRSKIREHEHWLVREQMAGEISQLEKTLREQIEEIDRLRAENKQLHQRKFKPRKKSKTQSGAKEKKAGNPRTKKKKRGAPVGHPVAGLPIGIQQTVTVDLRGPRIRRCRQQAGGYQQRRGNKQQFSH